MNENIAIILLAPFLATPVLYWMVVRRVFKHRWMCPICQKSKVCFFIHSRPTNRALFYCRSCRSSFETYIRPAELLFDVFGFRGRKPAFVFQVLPPDKSLPDFFFKD